jgi:hypothetical protein
MTKNCYAGSTARELLRTSGLPVGALITTTLDTLDTGIEILPADLTVQGALYVATTIREIPPGLMVTERVCINTHQPHLQHHRLGMDDRGYVFWAIPMRDGLHICAGCRNFTVEQARAHWGRTGHSQALGFVEEAVRRFPANPPPAEAAPAVAPPAETPEPLTTLYLVRGVSDDSAIYAGSEIDDGSEYDLLVRAEKGDMPGVIRAWRKYWSVGPRNWPLKIYEIPPVAGDAGAIKWCDMTIAYRDETDRVQREYRVRLRRTVAEETTMMVTASSREEAENIVCEMDDNDELGDLDWDLISGTESEPEITSVREE